MMVAMWSKGIVEILKFDVDKIRDMYRYLV